MKNSYSIKCYELKEYIVNYNSNSFCRDAGGVFYCSIRLGKNMLEGWLHLN